MTFHIHLCDFQPTESKAMPNMSVHQLPQYYQILVGTFTVWTASVTSYMHRKLAHTKIFQNFWLIEVLLRAY